MAPEPGNIVKVRNFDNIVLTVPAGSLYDPISRLAVPSDVYISSLWLMYPLLFIMKSGKHCYNTMIHDLLHILTQPSMICASGSILKAQPGSEILIYLASTWPAEHVEERNFWVNRQDASVIFVTRHSRATEGEARTETFAPARPPNSK